MVEKDSIFVCSSKIGSLSCHCHIFKWLTFFHPGFTIDSVELVNPYKSIGYLHMVVRFLMHGRPTELTRCDSLEGFRKRSKFTRIQSNFVDLHHWQIMNCDACVRVLFDNSCGKLLAPKLPQRHSFILEIWAWNSLGGVSTTSHIEPRRCLFSYHLIRLNLGGFGLTLQTLPLFSQKVIGSMYILNEPNKWGLVCSGLFSKILRITCS